MLKILKKRKPLVLLLIIILFVFLFGFIISGYHAAELRASFLPSIPPTLSKNISSDTLSLINNNFVLLIDRNGMVNIKSRKGEMIISGITYFSTLSNQKDNWGLTNIKVSKFNDSCINISGNGENNSKVNISFVTHRFLPKIDVKVNSFYTSKTIVNREALVVAFALPVSKVYLKNRKIDSMNLEPEYWLDHEGVRFGANETSALIYHTPNVSSLQLATTEQLLFINLDYLKDHPYIKILDQKGLNGKWADLSKSCYLPGSQHENSFTISVGNINSAIPRLMLVPYGYNAGYIFTEHADGGNIKKQRAAYLGSEDITNLRNAIGGFVANKIPVTKSVFYIGLKDSLGEAIKEKKNDTLLLDFLDQLHKTGLYDLCLHTPEAGNSNAESLNEAMQFMKKRYNTVSWIDHGFYTGLNKEVSVAEGFDSTSKYFAADFWEKYDTRYFWSPAVELINERNKVSVTDEIFKFHFYKAYVSLLRHYLSSKDLKTLSFIKAVDLLFERESNKYELNNLQSNQDNALPTPLYWQHPTRTRSIYYWSTYYVNAYNDLSAQKINKKKKQINNLIQNRGIFIDHEYAVRDIGPNNIIKINNGKLTINPYFNDLLKELSKKRDQHELYLTTIKELMDYWLSIKNISFQYLPNNEIVIFNHNNIPIKGLSLVINANEILVDGQPPSIKHVDGESIFWFDMPANSEKTIKIK